MGDHQPPRGPGEHDRPATDATDAAVRAALATGNVPHALATTVAAYGAEVYGFLRAVTRRGRDARRIYASFLEYLPGDLRGFAGEIELRVLVYTVARAAARRHRELPARVPATARVRLAPAVSIRLPAEDLELVVLRLDRGFTWRQLAHTSLGAPVAERALLAEADRLRARFLAVRRALSPREQVRA